jgi:hypothetical protein
MKLPLSPAIQIRDFSSSAFSAQGSPMQTLRPVLRPLARFALPVLLVGLGLPALVAPARADCNEDLGRIMQRREAAIQNLNDMAKASHGKLDPIGACPKLRKLVGMENELLAYMTKNKEWCAIPDNAIENASAGHAKTAQTANQACNIAVQMKKAQEQQANGGAGPTKLPAGPL